MATQADVQGSGVPALSAQSRWAPDALSATSIGVVAACALQNVISAAPLVNGSFSQFMLPVTQELHLSRTAFTAALTVLSIVGIFAYPLFGRMADRFGARRVMMAGILLYGLSVASLSLIGANLVVFYGLFLLVGAASAIPSSVVISKLVSGWFDRHRALVLGIVGGGGISLGYTLTPIIAAGLIGGFGWRDAYIGIGLIILLVGLPLTLFMREAPKLRAATIDSSDPLPVDGVTGKEARATARFWIMLAAVTLGAGASTIFYTHIFAFASDRGISPGHAIGAMSAAGAANGLWQIVLGRILDRASFPRVAAPMVLAGVLGLAILMLTDSAAAWILGGMLLGISSGSEYGLIPYALLRYFGGRAYGELYGFIYGVVWLSMGIFPLASAAVFDFVGSYTMAWIAGGVCMVLAAVLLLILPRFPERSVAA